MGKPEAKIENQLISTAIRNGYSHYKFQAIGNRGVPDQILIGQGRVLFIECKAEGKHVIPGSKQDLTIQDMRQHGADVRVINAKDQIDPIFKEPILRLVPPIWIQDMNTRHHDGTLEHTVERTFLRQAKKTGFLAYKFRAIGRRGVPDRLLIGHNAVYFVELKAPGENLRELQKVVTDNMRTAGAIVLVMNTEQACYEFFSHFA